MVISCSGINFQQPWYKRVKVLFYGKGWLIFPKDFANRLTPFIIEESSSVTEACFCQTPVLGLGVDFTFALDNNNNNDKGTVPGDKAQGVEIRDKG